MHLANSVHSVASLNLKLKGSSAGPTTRVDCPGEGPNTTFLQSGNTNITVELQSLFLKLFTTSERSGIGTFPVRISMFNIVLFKTSLISSN